MLHSAAQVILQREANKCPALYMQEKAHKHESMQKGPPGWCWDRSGRPLCRENMARNQEGAEETQQRRQQQIPLPCTVGVCSGAQRTRRGQGRVSGGAPAVPLAGPVLTADPGQGCTHLPL